MPQRQKSTSEDIIAALLDPAVADALGKALSDLVAKKVEDVLDTKLNGLMEEVAGLKKELAASKKEVRRLEEEVEELSAYSRCDNLIFHGLRATSYADASSTILPSASATTPGSASNVPSEPSNRAAELAVIRLANEKLDVPLVSSDISVALRLRSQEVIVRFTNRKIRNDIYAARKKLRNAHEKVFINEHLTPSKATVFKEARELTKRKNIKSSWTYNGNIYIKENDSDNPKKIADVASLFTYR